MTSSLPSAAVVYVAINRNNGKKYIGATDKGIENRAYKHFWNAKNGQRGKFYTAIRKHGPDAFEFRLLRECDDFFDALHHESLFIAELKPEYNLTSGGGGVKGLKFTAESREKMAAAKRGKPNHWSNGAMPQEIRDRLAAARRAERGRPLTGKQLKAMHENAAKANGARRRRVLCVSTGIEFLSVTAAAKEAKVTTSTISNLCAGKFGSRSGLCYRYID